MKAPGLPALFALLLAGAASAQSWRIDAWTSRAGLPSDSLNMLLPLADGHLLVTSFYEPPTLFDGHAFRPLHLAADTSGILRGASVAAQTSDGVLWFGTRDHGLVRVDRDGSLHPVPLAGGSEGLDVRALQVGSDGTLHVGTASGWFALHDPTGGADVRAPADELAKLPVSAIFEDRGGRIWLGGDRGLRVVEAGRLRAIDEPRLDTWIWSIHEDPRGGIWVGTRGSGLAHFDGSGWRFLDRAHGFANDVVRQVVDSDDGGLWAATSGGGLARLVDGHVAQVLTMGDGLTGDTYYWLHRDASGAIWAAGPGTGLNRVRPSAFSRWDGAQLASAFVWSLHQGPDGAIWAGTNAGIARWRDGRGERIGAPGPGYQAVCRSLLEDAEGGLLVGTEGGLFRWRDGRFRLFDATAGLQVWGLLEAADGSVYVGGDRLWRVRGDRIEVVDASERDSDRRIVALHHGDDGGLELLTANDGVWRWQADGSHARLTPPIRRLRAQWIDPDGRRWLTGQTLQWLDSEGELRTLDNLQRDHGRGLHALLPDQRGYLWVPSNIGLFRFRIDELRRYAAGVGTEPVPEHFQLSDGLTSSEFNGGGQSPAIRDRSGQLWFASTNGVTRVDPARVGERGVKLSATITGIESEQGWSPGGGAIVLRAGTRRVDLHFTALPAAVGGEASFEYRLLPVLDTWVAAGSGRRALFPDLDPGAYVFEVRATAPRTGGAPALAAQRFEITPHWSERRAVQVGIALLSLLAAAALPMAHILGLRRQRRRLLDEVADKTRALEQLASTDALTGLANRRVFDSALAAALAGDSLPALLLIDVDHFKRYNDALGHQAGDAALAEVGAILHGVARRGDLAARLGGEEFAILLGDGTAAAGVAARAIDALAARALAHPDSPVSPRLSASVGFAVAKPGESPESLYRRADGALYAAKAQGRARAVNAG